MNAPDLNLSGDRDAQAALEGYLYQLKLTLLRWLELGDQDVLCPETGEDMLVWQEALRSGSTPQPVLEQIKKRSRPITLNSPDARASLAHCYAHMRANPRATLRFRFITNARIGLEKSNDGGIPGITLWHQIQASDPKVSIYLQRIRKLLTSARRPDDASTEEWTAWQTFVVSALEVEFLQYVRQFEWSCGVDRVEDLDRRLHVSLKALSASALTREQSILRIQSLLGDLFERLTKPRPRTLRRADLVVIINRTNATEALPYFWAVVATNTVDRRDMLSAADVRALTSKLAASEVVPSPPQQTIIEEPPPIGARTVERMAVVTLVESLLAEHRWVNVRGAPGMGKTALASRLAHRQSAALWIAVPDGAADAVLQSAALALRSALLNASTLVVVDNIPPTPSRNALAALRRVVDQVRKADARLLTTSTSASPVALQDLCITSEVDAPYFSQDEIEELVSLFDPPAPVSCSGVASMLTSRTHGYPPLVIAALVFLHQSAWSLSSQSLSMLLDGSYADGARQDALIRLRETLPPPSRLLLSRASISALPISREEFRTLARISPSIEEPSLHIAAMEGVWLTKETRDRWRISSFARLLPRDMSPALRIECHATFARALEQSEIDLLSARILYYHYCEGAEPTRAIALLHRVLGTLIEHKPKQPADLVRLWLEVDLPADEVTVHTYLFVQTAQYVLRREYNIEPLTPLEQVLPLVHDVIALGGEDAEYAAGGVDLLLLQLIRGGIPIDPASRTQALPLLGLALRLAQTTPAKDVRHSLFASAFWALGGDASDNTERAAWLQTLTPLSAVARKAIAESGNAPSFAVAIADECWCSAVEAGATDARTWTNILDEATRLGELARACGVELLDAAYVRAQMVIQAEYRGQRQAALTLGESLYDSFENPEARFLVAECLARALQDAGERARAQLWFDRAVLLSSPRSDSGLALGVLVHSAKNQTDPMEAKALLLRALNDIKTFKCKWDWRFRVRAELALAQYRVGDQRDFVGTLSDAVDDALGSRAETAWLPVVVSLTKLAGIAVMRLNEGSFAGIDLAIPPQGCFLNAPTRQDLGGEFNRGFPTALCSFVARLAHISGDFTLARQWALRAREELFADGVLAAPDSASQALTAFGATALAYLACDEEFLPEALRIASELGMLGPANERWSVAFYWALLPGLISRLGNEDFTTRNVEREQQLVEACRALSAPDALGSVFADVADVLQEVLVRQVSYADAMDRGNAAARNGKPHLMSLFAFAPMIGGYLEPVFAVHSQLVILMQAMPGASPSGADSVLRSLKAYWRRRVDHEAFRFSAPRIFAQEIETIDDGAGVLGLRTLLRNAVRSTGARLPPAGSEFLAT